MILVAKAKSSTFPRLEHPNDLRLVFDQERRLHTRWYHVY